VVVEPAVGRLTGADTGKGRLPEAGELFDLARLLLERGRIAPDLTGRHVVVSAGGTHEPLDPVRFLGNRSSGRMGYALASTAIARGATVTVVAANVTLPDPAGAELLRVETTAQLRDRMLTEAAGADAVVMAAAPADYRPIDVRDTKMKKADDGSAPVVELTQNPDVLAELVHRRTGAAPFIVGFAAETGDADGDVLTHGHAKLARKGCDLLVVNDVSAGRVFGRADSEALLLGADGSTRSVPLGSKVALAHVIWDEISARLLHHA
jgi:phosphopantothenoylcysteine decarboxylase/phosphopantothenate--cysteine ligase